MLYAIMVPYRSLNFTWHHFTLSLFFPPFSLLSHCFFHSFMSCPSPLCIVFLILCHIFLFLYCFSHQSAQIHLGGFMYALRDNGPTSEPQFYLASFYPLPILSTVFIAFTLSLFFPPFLLLSHFFSIFLYQNPSFFPLFFLSYVIFPYFFYCFSHQSAQIHLGGRTRWESLPQRHPIATWYITLKKITRSTFFTTYFPYF